MAEKKSWCFSWQLKPKCTESLTHSFTFSPSLAVAYPFFLPQLIHVVTPFNRGQAVKDPITGTKRTFHISSVDSAVRTTNFMLKCTEIGGEFMRGGEGWRGKALSEWKGQSRESASASSVNVIARMWKMRWRGSQVKRKVRACLTQNNWLEDGLIRPLNQLPLVSFSFSHSLSFLARLLFHLFYSSTSALKWLFLHPVFNFCPSSKLLTWFFLNHKTAAGCCI